MSVSIWKIDESPGRRAEALLRMVQQVLEGLRLHAIEGDPTEHRKFQSDIQDTERKLHGNTPASEVPALGEAVVKVLEDYNLRTSRVLKQGALELQGIVTMLADTVAEISADSERSIAQLTGLESQLKQAAVSEDVDSLKRGLEECLASLAQEIVRKREDTAKMITSLHQALEKAGRHSSGEGPATRTEAKEAEKVDPLTGLPERSAAETELRQALQARSHSFLAIFALPQLPTLNARFGYQVVDQILVFMCQHIAAALPASASLFRWSGAAFLAVFETADTIEIVKGKLRDVAPARLRKTVRVNNREVLIMVGVSGKVLPVFEFSGEKDLIRSVDWFVESELKS